MARIDVEVSHTVSIVPRRGPEAAVVALIGSLTGVEGAGERRRESRLESSCLVWTTTTILVIKILELTSITTSG